MKIILYKVLFCRANEPLLRTLFLTLNNHFIDLFFPEKRIGKAPAENSAAVFPSPYGCRNKGLPGLFEDPVQNTGWVSWRIEIDPLKTILQQYPHKPLLLFYGHAVRSAPMVRPTPFHGMSTEETTACGRMFKGELFDASTVNI